MSLFSKLGDINEMKKQASAMQAMLAQEQVTATNNGVTITMNGNQEILAVNIEEIALNNKSDLEKSIKDTLADAIKQVQRLMASKLSGMM